VAGILKSEVLDLAQVVGLEDLDMAVSLTTENGVVVQLVEAIDNACRLNVLNSLQSVDLKHEQVVVCTTNEKL
jgi:hypothetical protein